MTVTFATSYTDTGREVRVLFYFADTEEEAQEFIKASEEEPYSGTCRFIAPTLQSASLKGAVPTKFWVIRKEEGL